MGRGLWRLTQWLRVALACASLLLVAVPISTPRATMDNVVQVVRPPRSQPAQQAVRTREVPPRDFQAALVAVDVPTPSSTRLQSRRYLLNCVLLC